MKKQFVIHSLFLLCCLAAFAQSKRKPNVLLIYTDDQGTLDVNIYGAEDLYTPNLDKLAREGVRFTQFYAAAPICSPSRASLMTGRYPLRTQLAANTDWLPTLTELCGIGLPEKKIDGRSLVPVIRSGQAASPHETFFWQSQGTRDNPQWAVREGRWKLLHNPISAKPAELNKDGFLLTDLQRDAGEQTNEAGQHPDIVAALTEKYRLWVTEVVQQ